MKSIEKVTVEVIEGDFSMGSVSTWECFLSGEKRRVPSETLPVLVLNQPDCLGLVSMFCIGLKPIGSMSVIRPLKQTVIDNLSFKPIINCSSALAQILFVNA